MSVRVDGALTCIYCPRQLYGFFFTPFCVDSFRYTFFVLYSFYVYVRFAGEKSSASEQNGRGEEGAMKEEVLYVLDGWM